MFPPELQRPENVSFTYDRIKLLNQLCECYSSQFDLTDFRAVFRQDCLFLGNPAIPFDILSRSIRVVIDLLERLRVFLPTQPKELTELLYSILVAIVRKVEDIRSSVFQDTRIRELKSASIHDDATNARFYAFMQNKPYNPPSLPCDEYGIHFALDKKGTAIGDVVVCVPRSSTLTMLQLLCKATLVILSFFNTQPHGEQNISTLLKSPTQQNRVIGGQNNDVQPLVFTERFVNLIYRFVLAFFNFGELYRAEKNHPREVVVLCSSCHS